MAAQYWNPVRYSEWCRPEPEIDREDWLRGIDERLRELEVKHRHAVNVTEADSLSLGSSPRISLTVNFQKVIQMNYQKFMWLGRDCVLLSGLFLALALLNGCGDGDTTSADAGGQASLTMTSATCTNTADAGGPIVLLNGSGSASSPTTGLLVSFAAKRPGRTANSGAPVCTNWPNCRRGPDDPQTTGWTGTTFLVRGADEQVPTVDVTIILRGAFGADIVVTQSPVCQ